MPKRVMIRVARRFSLEELNTRLRALERKHRCSFQEFQEKVNNGVQRGLLKDYVEWSYMVYALEAYKEGEEFDCVMNEEKELTTDLLSSLTPKRVQLLYEIPRFPIESINDLARRLGRDVKNVYNDLRGLEKLGLVFLRRAGRNVIPQMLIEELTFIFE